MLIVQLVDWNFVIWKNTGDKMNRKAERDLSKHIMWKGYICVIFDGFIEGKFIWTWSVLHNTLLVFLRLRITNEMSNNGKSLIGMLPGKLFKFYLGSGNASP